MRSPHHIYVHFPYCLYKCHYCDFNSFATDRQQMPAAAYVDSLIAEIAARQILYDETGSHFFASGTPIDTIFFGGGTPSLMEPAQVARVLEALAREFTLAPAAEITLEANPGTLDISRIRGFREAGVNRLSIGVQSLDDRNLARFGRIHTADAARQALRDAMIHFAGSVSADLIYGFPGQTLHEWLLDLEEVVLMGIAHLSCYALTAEPGTQFAADVKRGTYHETSDTRLAEMFSRTQNYLADEDLPYYEVSNFALPGRECRHNLGYWRYESYIGLGAGACSNFVPDNMPAPQVGKYSVSGGVIRTTNHKIPETYQRTLTGGENFFLEERLDRRTAMTEFIMMGLRLREGIANKHCRILFGQDLRQAFDPLLCMDPLTSGLSFDGSTLRVAQEKLIKLNSILLQFLPGQ